MNRYIVLIVLLSLAMVLNAQFAYDRPVFAPNFNPNFQLGGFLHPDQVKMNHSMSFVSGMASSGAGYYQSSYTNHLQFQLKPNLKMNVDMSVVNLGTMSHNNNLKLSSNNDNQNVVVPALSLEYKPSNNTTIYFEYRHVRGYSPYHGNPYNEWWR